MIIVRNKESLLQWRGTITGGIGFVPTMGALHAGHMSLVAECRSRYNFCVVSIFVNPTQFNNKEDFDKYPNPVEADIDLLEQAGCDCLFLPEVSTIYPEGTTRQDFPIGKLEHLLEGEFRPGHYQGVVQVVEILLDLVQPQGIFLGAKDYQQCMVLSLLINQRFPGTTIHISPTIRESSGLAMSSRNTRLSASDREQAVMIYKVLSEIKANISAGNIQPLIKNQERRLREGGFIPDYVSVADASTLEAVNNWDGKQKLVALVAAYLNEVRLIDNMELN